MARVVQRPAARQDFITHYAYLAENASFETAKRFRQAVDRTYTELAGMPRMGVPGKTGEGKYSGVRLWRVRRFKEYLIAYRPYGEGVAIERLIHAKQDYQRVLGQE
jgi:plasmid stabilization system protein ParE